MKAQFLNDTTFPTLFLLEKVFILTIKAVVLVLKQTFT